MGEDMAKLVSSGPSLVFVTFAEAIARLPLAPMFIVETVVISLCDEFPSRLRKNKLHMLLLCTVLFYAVSLMFCTQAGMYFLTLFEYYYISWFLFVIAFFESMALSWVYGTCCVDNLLDNIKWMTGYYPHIYIFWKILWKILSPFGSMCLILYTLMRCTPASYKDYLFPLWPNIIGWLISFLPVLTIVITAIYKFINRSGSCVKRFQDLMCPEDDWGPALAIHRAEEFPLQIPEAREPIKDLNLATSPAVDTESSDVQKNVHMPLIPLAAQDRETAI
ncbi:unnamed protein product [Soboliphyme baturini]|uniref:Sodium-and chloride-dependent GABA transporter 2 n=1 Tax=Soboliphyme baturini TaxID=241478 RepID=A0A183IK17_9BILA|nr:unnamed protein product [Soboliphyme baturini]